MKTSLAIYCIAIIFLLEACKSSSTAEETKTDSTATASVEATAPKTSTICLWNELSVKDSPGEKSKYLTSVYLGEALKLTGDTASEGDAKKKKNFYHKVILSDGKEGWVRDEFIAIDVFPAAFVSNSTLHKRPDMSAVTEKEFVRMDFVSAKRVNDDWMEVRGKRAGDKWFTEGYVKASSLTLMPVEVQFAALNQRANEETKPLLKQALLRQLADASTFQSSQFYTSMFVSESDEGIENVVPFAGTVRPQVITEGLLGWYPFTGNALDSSGNNNSGKVFGAVLTVDRFGNANAAYRFDGKSFITLTLNSQQGFAPPFSVCGWMKSDDPEGLLQTVASMGRTAGGTAFNFGMGSDKGAIGYLGFVGERPDGVESEIIATPTSWHFLAGTYDGKTCTLYLDGVLVSTKPFDNEMNDAIAYNFANSSQPLEIGRELATLDRYFHGTLDDVAIYTRALRADEVLQLYGDVNQ